jgi:hypothetical protein
MRATGVAKKDGSITVITFGHGGGDSPSPVSSLAEIRVNLDRMPTA